MLTPHTSSSLEYWYFKLNCREVALLVDWIERRKQGEHWLRMSIHAPGHRQVLFNRIEMFMPDDNFLAGNRTTGHVGDVAWDLEIDPGPDQIKPDLFPASLLRVLDLFSVSAPRARFKGHITVGTQTVNVDNAPGLVSHYWGRRLAPEWWWISANQFDNDDMAVECCVLKSGAWGLPLSLSVAYLYLTYQKKSRLFVVPFGLANVKGTPQKFTVRIQPFGHGAVVLKCAGRAYGDFGEGIINTLVGDLEVWIGDVCVGRATGTAGLERRAKM